MTDNAHQSNTTQPDGEGSTLGAPGIEPMTPSLMGRLFVVPAVIVCVLLGVAVVVVMFGSTTVDKPLTVAELLDKVELSGGERTLGMLLPQAKDSWQAAQELAKRFGEKDKYLQPGDVEPAAGRLIKMLEREPPRGTQRESAGGVELYSRHLFLIAALGLLESPSAVPTLTKLTRDPDWEIRRTAIAALASMHTVAQARAAMPEALKLLNDEQPAVQIVACAAIASLVDPTDATARATATKALAERLEAPREVQWNAAMTLARLGDARGRLVLMNMLDRGYWEKIELEYDQDGTTIRRKYGPDEIEHNLKTAIETAMLLNDAELAGLVKKLEDDPSVRVRTAARAAMAKGGVGYRDDESDLLACRARVGSAGRRV